MKRITLCLLPIAILIGSLAIAQVGPKQKEKPKPKKKKIEEGSDLQPGERIMADTAVTESAAAKQQESGMEQPRQTVVIESSHVKRAIFTTGIEQREPVDIIDSLSTDTERIYFFTEIAGMQDKTIRHRWIYDNQVRMELPIAIGGPNWRVYSRKKLPPDWTGEWTVLVVDEEENVLGKKKLVYYRPAAEE